MTAFILIIFIKSGYAGGAFSQEFTSQQTCEAAQTAITERFDQGMFGSIRSVCVPK